MGNLFDKHVTVWHVPVYTSATLTIDGNSGLTAFPDPIGQAGAVFYPLSFELEGQNITTDETLTLAVGLYPTNDAAWSIGSVTFAAATAGTPKPPLEKFPGDITTTGLSGLVPCPPYFLAAWTLAGTTKSMNFILYASGVLVR